MKTCRACLSNELFLFYELGDHPPANQFLSREDLDKKEQKFTLNIYACLNCGLIQVANYLTHVFYKNYVYVPSCAESMHRHFNGLADVLKARFLSKPQDILVDIGCNDGLFLEFAMRMGVTCYGIEPSSNIGEIAKKKGIPVIESPFNSQLAGDFVRSYGKARVVTTTNTFNHIDDLQGFVEGVRLLLEDGGVFCLEIPSAKELIIHNEFDTVYHEHLNQFSLKSLVELFHLHSLEVFDVEAVSIHGGSMRVFAQKKDSQRMVSASVTAFRNAEDKAGLLEKQTYYDFYKRVEINKAGTMSLLKKLKSEGNKLMGYGAPAKGNTLLNYYGIGPDLLDCLVDKNKLKQGLFSPGMHIPIHHPSVISENPPDYLVILAWNFADEIMDQQKQYHANGGKFIIPIPYPKVI